jgi:hypothetical protein
MISILLVHTFVTTTSIFPSNYTAVIIAYKMLAVSRLIPFLTSKCKKIKIGIVEGGVHLGPLGTAATNRPIVPAPGDYDDGEIGRKIGWGSR